MPLFNRTVRLFLGVFEDNCGKDNAVCFLSGNSPVSEFYMPTFRNTLFHLHRQGNCPKESIQRSEHGESLKSR